MIEYSLKRLSRSRSIRVKVSPSGQILVTAPLRSPKGLIDKFVIKSEPWIKQQLKKIQFRRQVNPILDWDQKLICYLGILNQFEHDQSSPKEWQSEAKVKVESGLIRVRPITGEIKHVKSTLLKWLQAEAEIYFRKRVPEIAQIMNVNYSRLTFRQQSSRWGSCSSSGTLSFNWRLIHFRPEVIDYVIIHELAHVKHMDHSRQFWDLVGKFDPDYRSKVRFLKMQVLELE